MRLFLVVAIFLCANIVHAQLTVSEVYNDQRDAYLNIIVDFTSQTLNLSPVPLDANPDPDVNYVQTLPEYSRTWFSELRAKFMESNFPDEKKGPLIAMCDEMLLNLPNTHDNILSCINEKWGVVDQGSWSDIGYGYLGDPTDYDRLWIKTCILMQSLRAPFPLYDPPS